MNPVFGDMFGLSPTELTLASPNFETPTNFQGSQSHQPFQPPGPVNHFNSFYAPPPPQPREPARNLVPEHHPLIDHAFNDYHTPRKIEPLPPLIPGMLPTPRWASTNFATPKNLQYFLRDSRESTPASRWETNAFGYTPTGFTPKVATFEEVIVFQVLCTIESDHFDNRGPSWEHLDVNPFVIDPNGITQSIDTTEQDDEIHYCADDETDDASVFFPSPDRGSHVKATIQKNIEVRASGNATISGAQADYTMYIQIVDKMNFSHWQVSAACYASIPGRNMVVFPVTQTFSKNDFTPENFTSFFCSFRIIDTKLHNLNPSAEICAKWDSDCESIIVEEEPVDKSTIREHNTRGGRPEGPSGLLLTRLQREKLVEIRRKIRNKTKRDLRYVIEAKDLYPFFTIGRDEVAERLAICITLLKKICRKNGITRWPNRKLIPTGKRLVELKKMLSALESVGVAGASIEKVWGRSEVLPTYKAILQKIDSLRAKRVRVLQDILSPEAFQMFLTDAPANALEPDWE